MTEKIPNSQINKAVRNIKKFIPDNTDPDKQIFIICGGYITEERIYFDSSVLTNTQNFNAVVQLLSEIINDIEKDINE